MSRVPSYKSKLQASLSHDQFFARFRRLEKESDLFSLKVKGRAIWDYLRYPLFWELLFRAVRKNEISFSPARAARHCRELVKLPGVLWQTVRRGRGPYDLIIFNYERKKRVEDQVANIHFYPIVKRFHKRYRILLVDPSPYHEEVESVYPCDVFRSRFFLHRARIGSMLMSYSKADQQVIQHVQMIVENQFRLKLDMDRMVNRYFSYQFCLYKNYLGFFGDTQPKLILYSDSGNCKGWIEAAHELGISVVDFQHSLVSEDSILYDYPQAEEVNRLRTLPDYIFTFGEFWHDQYKLPTRLIPVGFPYQEMEAGRQKNLPRGNRVVIISSMHSGKKLEELALQLSERLPDFEIIYKLRPEEYARWREVYSSELALRPNIRVIDGDEPSLYEIFATSTHQVGINSTAVIEGMVFGLTTFIFKDGWYRDMQLLIDREMVFLVSEVGEIVSRIAAGAEPSHKPMTEVLFKPHSLENIRRALDHLICR